LRRVVFQLNITVLIIIIIIIIIISDEEVRIAVAHRLGCKACEPRTIVDAANQSMQEVSTAWLVAGVDQDSSATGI